MKATELLDQVKSLPSSEWMVFIDLVHQWESQIEIGTTETKPLLEKPDYAGRLKALFPNGPIQGDPQLFWDDLRGERF